MVRSSVMANHCDNDSVFDGKHNCLLSRSSSPTLIYPLPSSDVQQTDIIPGAKLDDLFSGRDCLPSFPFAPQVSDLDFSQNSLGALGSSLHRSLSRSPEGRQRKQKQRKSVKEVPFSHQSMDNSLVSCSTPGRSTVVTDLDEAMAQMDQMYLKSLFGDITSNVESLAASHKICHPSIHNNDETEETNIDDESPSVKMVVNLRQKVVEAERSQDLSSTSKFTTPEHRKQFLNRERYIPNVTFDAAVKWPHFVPKILSLQELKIFDGETLVSWLCSEFDETHYLHQILTHHDIRIIIAQLCTHLLSAGVLNDVGNKPTGNVFKTQNQYSWVKQDSVQVAGSSNDTISSQHACLTSPSRAEEKTKDEKEHASVQSATDLQENIKQITEQYKELEKKLKREYEEEISKIRRSFADQMNTLSEQILDLQNELKQYRSHANSKNISQVTETMCTEIVTCVSSNSEVGILTGDLNQHHTHRRKLGEVLTSESTSSSENCQSSNGECQAPLTSFSSISVAPTVPQEFSLNPQHLAPPMLSNEAGKCPPPPPPPLPPTTPGCPVPPPPPGAPTLLQKRESAKPVINPKSPMKPLFWKRIQVQAVSPNSVSGGRNIFWEEIAEEPVNFQYLEELFAKIPVEPKKKVSANKVRPKAMQVAKIIQSKRSQAVGILLSSLRLDFTEIEDAILNLDTSILDIEKFRAIYDNRSDSEEMKMIKSHIEAHPEIPLDKPEQFLYVLEQIPFVTDRIFCFIFHSSFQESIATIDSKLNNVKMTCETLSSSESVKRIFGLILACGNYMNGGSRTRGQADGFDLEILPKLKDVKGKDNCTSLLQFVVTRYVHQYDTEVVGTDRAKLPLPDPSDIQQAGLVNFEDIERELKKIHRDFKSAEDKAKNIITFSSPESVEPFKFVMTSFFDKGRQDLKEQEENLVECSKLFDSTCIFFCVKPKNNEQCVTPEQFFSLWISFCSDFKDIWKKEQQAIMKIRIREAEERIKTIKGSKLALPTTRAKQIGGLKDKLSRHGKL